MTPTAAARKPATENGIEHREVIVVGAGISGIGAGCHLETHRPGTDYAILEARDAMGGTWDLFRYPGIRSDSDMHTLGFSFEPWTDPTSLAGGPAILDYVRETARKYGVDGKVRYGNRVVGARWSTEDARWTLDLERGGEPAAITCDFLFVCSGYYSYENPYTPEFPGRDRFGGEVIHPQHWPEDLDYAGKRVVVIGSGATAITIVPAMTEKAEHVTMLQRSPSYIASVPAEDPIAKFVRRILPPKGGYKLVRWKNVLLMSLTFNLSRKRPGFVRRLLRKQNEKLVPEGFDIDTHLNPKYNPWDERMCMVPDGDLFRALRRGKASIVTDRIATFTEKGLLLESGEELEADIIITATGLNLQLFGGVRVSVDGREVVPRDTLTYKSLMLSDVPNLAFSIGYTNASWTLKVDLTSEWVCRVLEHMEKGGYDTVVAPRDGSVGDEPLIDFSSGYVQRALPDLPRQGDRHPWRLHMNYFRDIVGLRRGELEDGTLQFSRRRTAGGPGAPRETREAETAGAR